MKSIVTEGVFVAVVGLLCAGLSAADYVWTGAEDARWVNANNWTDSSGNPVAKCPGVAASGDETADWAAARIEADTAIFSGVSSRTTIDLAGLFAISNVKFDGASIPAYVLGTDDTQMLPLRPGATFTVAATVVNMPSVAANVQFPLGYTTSTPTVTFSNKSTGELSLCGFVAGVKDPNSSQSYYHAQMNLNGKGGYCIGGNTIASVDLYAATSGKLRFTGDFTGVRQFYLKGTTDIEIEAAASVRANQSFDHYFSLNTLSSSDVVTFSGEGAFHMVSKTNNKQNFSYMDGNLVFTCPVTVDASTWGGIILGSGNGGSLEFQGDILSGFSGPIEVSAPVAFRAASIGANKTASKAGTGSLVSLSKGGILEYTGAGETTTRNIEITSGTGVLRQSGSGGWTVSSPIAVSAADATLKLDGASVAKATLTTAIMPQESGTLGLTKAGSGTWCLAGADTFNGAVSFEGGRIVVTSSAAGSFAAATGVTVKGGATVEIEEGIAAISLPTLTCGASGGTVLVPAGCTVTLGATPVADGGTVDFRLAGDGRVVCSAAAGAVVPGVTVEGVPAVFSSTGELRGDKYPDADTVIAARGGVIPDAASAQVAIALPGGESDGPITLEKPVTTIDALIQKESVPATVSLAGGSLKLATLSMMPHASALTVGSWVGDGSVVATDATLTLENLGTDAELCVNSTVAAGANGGTLKKTGLGNVSVKGLSGTWNATPAEGRLALSGTGDFNVSGSVAGGARLALSDIANVADTPAASTVTGFLVGNRGAGILEIGEGTAMTNRLYVGYGSGGCGAVYQTGGYFLNRGRSGDGTDYIPGVGHQGYGYYELRGGTYAEGGATRQMCAVAGGTGVMDIYGGAVRAVDSSAFWMNAKASSVGVIVLRDGVFEVKGSMRATDNKGDFVFTQDGANSVSSFSDIAMNCSADSTTTFNLNGGTFTAAEIFRWNTSNVKAVFNFNGGTMKATVNKDFFRIVSGRVAIDHVFSYGRGAAFDTAGTSVNLGKSLETPTDSGVVAIGWTEADAAEKYIGAPAIIIKGDGFGATACADFDYLTGCVTNIRVTCSGSGYTEGNVTATLRYNSTSRTLPVTLGSVVPGGLVKKGKGTLTLDQINTYAGETAVEGGTLKAGVEGAIPSGGTLRLDGGTLDLNGQTPTFSGICGAGGAVVNGAVTLAGEWVADVASLGEGTALNGDLAFADGASIRVASADKLDPTVRKRYTLVKTTNGHVVSGTPQIVGELPKDWKVSVSSVSVRLHYCEGLMMIVR